MHWLHGSFRLTKTTLFPPWFKDQQNWANKSNFFMWSNYQLIMS
ncbi:hypothetical protein MPL3356_630001 [Mesorhizobium plurifarium]|uniref:Uncharacterized protein n=1 Tax=Mesorhizobium plurifarium TaxID=69974 RepID=A0A090EBG1_MESPL|nr:hypothetical protein MPL3356_630001 [Mesorhizobium plurifarium]CDX60805.1 hypothetical protein MPL3365_440001 [Mesorhizobium plurifarium]